MLEPISKMHLGSNRRISARPPSRGSSYLRVRIAPAAGETREFPAKRELPSAASPRNSLDFARKAIFEMGSKHIIINYHYVRDPQPEWGGIYPCPVKEFERQIEYLAKGYSLVSIPEVYRAAQENSSQKFCAVTFDDGFQDQFENALPVLKKFGCKATFFIITSVWDGKLPSAHRIHILSSKVSMSRLVDLFNEFLGSFHPELVKSYWIPKDRRLVNKRFHEDVVSANFKETMICLDAEIKESFLDSVLKELGLDEKVLSRDLFMSEDIVRALSKQGFFVESHTHSHQSLENQQRNFLKEDLETSTEIFRKVLGYAPSVISYPHGRISSEAKGIVQDCGFSYGVTIDPRNVSCEDNPLLIPRYDTNHLRDFLNALL